MTQDSTPDILRDQLRRSVGVNPSDDWLAACLAHLQQSRQSSVAAAPVTADDILQEILRQDLRDVVRPVADSRMTRPPSADHPSQQLRRAIQESISNGNKLSKLPNGFRLMVQMEECLDMSVNAEARLSVGPSSQSAPTPVGNQRNRCLKLLLSDGHLPVSPFLVAMEIRPIANLSTNSLAGLKLLISGNVIEARLGMLLLDGQNCTVVGGAVDALTQVQKKALDQAKKVAGVGVDPTIKALVGTNTDALLQQEEDEGEGESGDVVSRPQRAPTNGFFSSDSQNVPPGGVNQRNVVAGTFAQASGATVPLQTRPSTFANCNDHSTVPLPMSHSTTSSTARVSSSSSRPVSVTAKNPYSNSSPLPRTQNISSSASPGRPHQPPTSTFQQTPLANQATAAVTTGPSTESASRYANPFAPSSGADSVQPTPAQNPVAAVDAAIETSTEFRSGSVRNLPTSIEELRSLQEKLVADPSLWDEYDKYKKTFIVPAKLVQYKGFDIEKNPAYDKKRKNAKHIYALICRFGTSASSCAIEVQIADSMLEPFFGMPAVEMRKLNKSNREEATRLVDEGGDKVVKVLEKFQPWEFVLRTRNPYGDASKGTSDDKPMFVVNGPESMSQMR